VTDQAEKIAAPIELTDTGNGERFARQHGHVVKHIHSWGKWLVWDNRRWAPDTTGEVWRLAKKTARGIYSEASNFTDADAAKAVATWAHSSQSRHRLGAMLDLARSEQPIPLDHETLDADGWLLNCENGTVDLRTGQLREHNPADFLSMSTGIEYPEGETSAPRWTQFLNEIFEGNQNLITYVQRLCGVALVGHIREHILPIAIGCGSNGKSVFTETARSVLGDYSMVASQGLLMVKKYQAHATEVADLFRRRLVIVSETNDGERLNEGLIKVLTGGEAVRARRMREDFWQFEPSHTILLVSNHRPIVSGTDTGIWRRLRIIPFNARIATERQDNRLTEKLREEWPAILKWMVGGCLEWQRIGLSDPDEVLDATGGYRADQDVLGGFIADCCMTNGTFRVQSGRLYEAYKKWAEESGERIENRRKFSCALEERGFEKIKNNQVWYVGLTLTTG
jgi:putative DNA primase/helicase